MKQSSDRPHNRGKRGGRAARPVVLTFVRFYLPGFKFGGPVRTIANMVDALGDEFEFRIVTSDRDMLDSTPYANTQFNKWTRVGKSWVYYASPERRRILDWYKLIRQQTHDVLYLNSLFDFTFTLKPLLVHRLLRSGGRPVVLAPRGELFPGALALKRRKKAFFLLLARLFGFYRSVVWHASTEEEGTQIRRCVGEARGIAVARNVATRRPTSNSNPVWDDSETALRVIFLSRIAQKKNLDYALQVLAKCNTSVRFDIWGTIEDTAYWRICQLLMKELPSNVQVSYKGVANHSDVHQILARYDLLFFPTSGENYGHVIAESLSVGTPVLISDQTPWRDLAKHGVGWDLPLGSGASAFLQSIEVASQKVAENRVEWRQDVSEYALKRLSDPQVVSANRSMLLQAIRLKRSRQGV